MALDQDSAMKIVRGSEMLALAIGRGAGGLCLADFTNVASAASPLNFQFVDSKQCGNICDSIYPAS